MSALILAFVLAANHTLYRHPTEPVTVAGDWAYPGAAMSASAVQVDAGLYRWWIAYTPHGGAVRLVDVATGEVLATINGAPEQHTPLTASRFVEINGGFVAHQIKGGALLYTSVLEEYKMPD